MRKQFVAFFLMFAALYAAMMPQTASADVTGANIFNQIGGTTTIDPGGAIHSQARSIYSFGGGMVSFQGKNVQLLAADPPSFNAGCSGISWHFGGFSFISMDELRQMVEAIAQASLGIAIDLAMHVLCPQCYAVMSKLRELASMMRNAAANACQLGEMLGDKILQSGGYSPSSIAGQCGSIKGDSGSADSWLGGAISVCQDISQAMGTVSSEAQAAVSWLNSTPLGAAASSVAGFFSSNSGSAPSKAALDRMGNSTYEALTALGYPDGALKDFLLSYTGMEIIVPPSADCRNTFRNLVGTPLANNSAIAAILTQNNTNPDTVSAIPASSSTSTSATSTNIAPHSCFAPPLNMGVQDLARHLICGFDANSDAQLFANRFPQAAANIGQSALAATCALAKSQADNSPAAFSDAGDPSQNPYVYHCDSSQSGTGRCLYPQETTLNADLGESQSSGGYTGVGWMVMDALYAGVQSVQTNQAWTPETLRIVNGSDYPLYRLINVAAVYPGLADDLIQSYSDIIAVQYTMDTLNVMVSPGGGMPTIDTRSAHAGVTHADVSKLQEMIANNLVIETTKMKNTVQERLAQKRALVSEIIFVNRAMQAEVISQGLGGNSNLAVSLKQQSAFNAEAGNRSGLPATSQ